MLALLGISLLAYLFGGSVGLHTQELKGHQVLKIWPRSFNDANKIKTLVKDLDLDIWRMPLDLSETIDVMVGPASLQKLTNILEKNKLKYEVWIKDLDRIIQEQAHESHARRRRTTPTLYSDTQRYLSYSEILSFLDRVNNSLSKVADTEVIEYGRSFENRSLKLIKLSRGGPNPSKPAIFIDAGIHAREWVAPATAINIIYKLAINPSGDPAILDLLDKFTWYIAPLVNPDGYEYTRRGGQARLWRKTRSRSSDLPYCVGVDANRNFGFHWNPYSGGSVNPCDEVYAGSGPLSEPESRSLASVLQAHRDTIKAYLTYHSYGQYILYPWGYDRVLPTDMDELKEMAESAGHAMVRPYRIGTSARLLYPAAGGSDDYAKGAIGIKYAYTIELPPSDSEVSSVNNGFLLRESSMPRVANDAFKGVQGLAVNLHQKLNEVTPSGGDLSASLPWWAGLLGR